MSRTDLVQRPSYHLEQRFHRRWPEAAAQVTQHPYRVPPGEFYLLGDNRAISCDSRYWGPVKGSSIIGKVVLVWWHDDHPDLRRS
jgi:signal peptidase I